MATKSSSGPASAEKQPSTSGAAQKSASEPYGKAWGRAWLGALAIAFLSGALHRGYQRQLGELRAHQVSCVLLLVLLTPWGWRTERHHPLPSGSAAMQAGVLWAAETVTFEFVFGHYVNRDTWAELLNAYDVRKGRLWLFDVIGIAAAPGLAGARRLRRQRSLTASEQQTG